MEVDHVSSEDSGDNTRPLDGKQMLEAARKKRFKSAVPDKEDDLEHDVGALATFDLHPVSLPAGESGSEAVEQALIQLARDNTQLLLNKVFSQPATRTADGVFAELPDLRTALPREKPLPAEKPPTRWEEFQRLKGLKKDKKRSRYEWNEEREQFMPRWGKGSAANDPMKDWLVEEPDSAPWGADTEALIGKGRADRRKAIAKQKKQQLMNKVRASRRTEKSMPGSASISLITGGSKLSTREMSKTVKQQLVETQKATASAGIFQPEVKGQPKLGKGRTQRRPVAFTEEERTKQSAVLERVIRKKEGKSGVDVDKAVRRHKHEERMQKQAEKEEKRAKQRKRRK